MDELTDDALTGDLRLLQRRRGHRFSLDDVVTAFEAASRGPPGARYADLGCGVGSVLLMVAWKLAPTRLLGVEAQAESLALAVRNVARAGLAERTDLALGDLRDLQDALRPLDRRWERAFDLVTGTPPYLPVGTALPSPDPQRAACRLELRGGVEAYILAGSQLLAAAGHLVVCADGRTPSRVLAAAEAAELQPTSRLDVVARAGRGPLFSVWTLRRPAPGREGLVARSLEVRDASGERTAAGRELRTFFGLADR